MSSNAVFAELAVGLGDELLDYYRLFQLGSEAQIELGGVGRALSRKGPIPIIIGP